MTGYERNTISNPKRGFWKYKIQELSVQKPGHRWNQRKAIVLVHFLGPVKEITLAGAPEGRTGLLGFLVQRCCPSWQGIGGRRSLKQTLTVCPQSGTGTDACCCSVSLPHCTVGAPTGNGATHTGCLLPPQLMQSRWSPRHAQTSLTWGFLESSNRCQIDSTCRHSSPAAGSSVFAHWNNTLMILDHQKLLNFSPYVILRVYTGIILQ